MQEEGTTIVSFFDRKSFANLDGIMSYLNINFQAFETIDIIDDKTGCRLFMKHRPVEYEAQERRAKSMLRALEETLDKAFPGKIKLDDKDLSLTVSVERVSDLAAGLFNVCDKLQDKEKRHGKSIPMHL